MGHKIDSTQAVRYSALFPAFEADAMAAMIEREPLGEDNVPDLILMNYKGADFVGHKYGPDSDEMRVTLREMDRQVKRMLSALEAKVGNDYLLAVTADHGMPPEPSSPDRRHLAPSIVDLLHEKFDPEAKQLITSFEPENGQIFGSVRQVADSMAFPNGMAVTPDNSTLIIAESQSKRLTAFDIGVDGNLSNRRVWADLGDGVPDGICIDADNAVWYADVPNKRCVRVREEGDVLQTINFDRGCFACMLGGVNDRTLFVVATEWRGMENVAEVARTRTGQVLTIEAPASGVGWP